MNNIECPFCKEEKNRNDNPIKKDRIIAETKNLIVFPTTGGFVKNYQLIVPKKHLNCFGELTKEELQELKFLIEWQKNINKNYFNSNTSMFEHGALIPHNTSGKSIVHAHLHVFPNNTTLINKISKYGFNINRISDISELSTISRDFENYLYYQDIDGTNYVITHDGIPSQFLRKVLAESKGIENWNWRKDPYLGSIIENINFYEENSNVYNLKGDEENDYFTKRRIQ